MAAQCTSTWFMALKLTNACPAVLQGLPCSCSKRQLLAVLGLVATFAAIAAAMSSCMPGRCCYWPTAVAMPAGVPGGGCLLDYSKHQQQTTMLLVGMKSATGRAAAAVQRFSTFARQMQAQFVGHCSTLEAAASVVVQVLRVDPAASADVITRTHRLESWGEFSTDEPDDWLKDKLDGIFDYISVVAEQCQRAVRIVSAAQTGARNTIASQADQTEMVVQMLDQQAAPAEVSNELLEHRPAGCAVHLNGSCDSPSIADYMSNMTAELQDFQLGITGVVSKLRLLKPFRTVKGPGAKSHFNTLSSPPQAGLEGFTVDQLKNFRFVVYAINFELLKIGDALSADLARSRELEQDMRSISIVFQKAAELVATPEHAQVCRKVLVHVECELRKAVEVLTLPMS